MWTKPTSDNCRDGQKATFTVDAYPGRRYPARVIRVDFGSQIKDNVVTYPTLLDVDNYDLTLRPGMTATAEITTVERADALLVPNAALRFTPPERVQPSNGASGGFAAKLVPRMPRPPPRKAGTVNRTSEQHVYVLHDGQPVQAVVTTGASDGRHTEILKGDLAEGTPVIVDTVTPAK